MTSPHELEGVLPDWYTTALTARDVPRACLTFTSRFLSAPLEERQRVRAAWDPAVRWATPDPERLACLDGGEGTRLERIRADLLFHGFAGGLIDDRDFIVGLAGVHHSCLVAGIDPRAVFEEIAVALGGRSAELLRAFSAREARDQALEAFGLMLVPDPGGGYRVCRDPKVWSSASATFT